MFNGLSANKQEKPQLDGHYRKGITTIIFDLDGTLLYTLDDLLAAVNYALSKNGMPERTLGEVRSFVGNGIKKLIERSVPAGTKEMAFQKCLTDFREYYDLHCTDYTRTYPGVLELLHRLSQKGYALAIVSNKVDSAVKELNRRFFSEYISVAIGEKEGIEKKPAPDTVYAALKELGKTREEAIYIGDSDVDLMTARNAGLPCISVLWGFRDKDFLMEQGAACFAQKAEDVDAIIEML